MVSNPRPSTRFNTVEQIMQNDDGVQPKLKRPPAPLNSLHLMNGTKKENDLYNYEYRLLNAISLVDRSTILTQRDKELLSNFHTALKATDVSTGAKYIFHLKVFGEKLGCEFEKATRKDIERFSTWLNQDSGYTPHTRADYINAIRRFYKYIRTQSLEKDIPYPEEVGEFDPKTG